MVLPALSLIVLPDLSRRVKAEIAATILANTDATIYETPRVPAAPPAKTTTAPEST